MKWKIMNKREASKIAEQWESMRPKKFDEMMENLQSFSDELTEEYRDLRRGLLEDWERTKEDVRGISGQEKRQKYLTDLLFALRLYERLKNCGMDIRYASYDDVWIYLQMKVVPEIVIQRYGVVLDAESGTVILPLDHMFKKSARIYMKAIWWYLFLSFRTDEDGREDYPATQKMLWYRTTDTILQMVERAGREGYRVDVSRELMKVFCQHQELGDNDFRKLLILNTARAQVMEPALCEGGISGYVKELFDYFEF